MTLFVEQLREFVGAIPQRIPVSASDKIRTYTESADYLIGTTYFHNDIYVKQFEADFKKHSPGTRFLDVGCCTGSTGLALARRGYHVGFHDFEGLGLEFIRWLSGEESLDTDVIPYGTKEPVDYNVAIALDVMEHTGNHLGFIRWISSLAPKVIITYPLMAFAPPYEMVIDEWIDDEAVRTILYERYTVLVDHTNASRRFLIWTVK